MANFSGLGVAEVSEYRAYTIGYDGHIASFRKFVCDSDADATVWTKQLLDGHDIELWSGERFVMLLESASKPGAVTYKVIDGRMVPKFNILARNIKWPTK
jgi:hypothetical protein